MRSGAHITAAYLAPDARERYPEACEALLRADAVYEVAEGAARALADTQAPQGIFCVVERPDSAELRNLDAAGAYLVLEDIRDPGNLGTMLRTAEALALDAVVLSEGCADLFSPKVTRASMGAVFRLPAVTGADAPQALRQLGEHGVKTYAAVASGGALDIRAADLSGGVALAVGNEGNGLTEECVRACGARVTIPMRGRAESLNAASAAAILVWELARRREAPAAR